MPTNKKTKKPSTKKQSKPLAAESLRKAPRKRKITRHRSFHVTKRSEIVKKPLPTFSELFTETVGLFRDHRWYYFKLVALYSLLVFIFIKGFGSAFNLATSKQQVTQYFGSSDQSFSTSYSLFSEMVGSFNAQLSDAAGVYQLFITVMIILASIWSARQFLAGEHPQMRDAFYKGMSPIVPFLMVIVIIALQLIPLAVGNLILSTVVLNNLVSSAFETVVWLIFFVGMALLSLYMILSSIFALNIVTLSDVRPLQALKAARNLVIHRRMGIFARIFVVPVLLLVISGIIFIPLIMFVPTVAELLFLVAGCFALVFMTTYMYNLYRKLL